MAAPSVCSSSLGRFSVITEPEDVSAIKVSIVGWGDYNAPLVMVVCGYGDLILRVGDDGVIDCAAAIKNMLPAATVMGLGSVWIGGLDPAKIWALPDIFESVHPVGVVYFGYPAEQWAPRAKYFEDAVHWMRQDRVRTHPSRPGAIVTRKL